MTHFKPWQITAKSPTWWTLVAPDGAKYLAEEEGRTYDGLGPRVGVHVWVEGPRQRSHWRRLRQDSRSASLVREALRIWRQDNV